MLTEFSGIGSKREHLAKGLRCLPHDRYVIYYKIVKNSVVIVRVAQGSRDARALFRG
jgi:plasmid stabilization system protein ParE